MSLDFRVLRWWPDEHLQELAARISGALAEWRAEWDLPAACGSRVQCLAAHEAGQGEFAGAWTLFGIDAENGERLWLRTDEAPREMVCAALFGAQAAGPIAAQFAARAWEDGCMRIRRLLAFAAPQGNGEADAAAPEDAHFQPWSGALVVLIQGGALDMRLHLGPTCVERLLPAQSRLPKSRLPIPVPVLQALQGRTLNLRVMLDEFELDLGSLASLAAGDVVQTTHALDHPLCLAAQDGAALGAGFLGQAHGKRALELARSQRTKHLE